MALLKRPTWQRVSICLTELGYEVQVYGQTVMRTEAYRGALRFAAALRRLFRKQTSRPRGGPQ